MGFINLPVSFIPIPPVRTLGTISGYITIQESTTDTLTITKQPVQQGASITDHAYMEPVVFSGKFQFDSNLFNLFKSLSQLYKDLLDLQSSRVPFDIVTPKRVYQSMLISSLGVTTDRSTENVLSVSITCQQIVIVTVSTTNVPRSAQANPGTTGATQSAGQKQSSLLTITQGALGFIHPGAAP